MLDLSHNLKILSIKRAIKTNNRQNKLDIITFMTFILYFCSFWGSHHKHYNFYSSRSLYFSLFLVFSIDSMDLCGSVENVECSVRRFVILRAPQTLRSYLYFFMATHLKTYFIFEMKKKNKTRSPISPRSERVNKSIKPAEEIVYNSKSINIIEFE